MNDTFTKTEVRRMLAEAASTWQPWFILEEAYAPHLAARLGAATSDKDDDQEDSVSMLVHPDGTGVLSIRGVLTPVKYGKASYEDIAILADKLRMDDNVKGVVLDIDSPGGMVAGIGQASQAIEALSAVKPVVAYTQGMMASAAYWLGANAHAIVAGPASMTGSVGVVMQHFDLSGLLGKFGIAARVFTNKQADLKGMGAIGVPLSEKQEAYLQDHIDGLGQQFLAHIGAKRPQIPASALRGQVLLADNALSSGVIDSIGSFMSAVRLAGGK